MKQRTSLLLKVMSRLGELKIEEKYLPRTNGRETLGIWYDDKSIVINPMPQIVDTLVHEVLHELFPNYSERAICSLTGKLTKKMTEEEVQTIYSEYRRKVAPK